MDIFVILATIWGFQYFPKHYKNLHGGSFDPPVCEELIGEKNKNSKHLKLRKFWKLNNGCWWVLNVLKLCIPYNTNAVIN